LNFWTIFFVFGVDGMICGCYKGVGEMFLSWKDLNLGFFYQKSCNLILYAPLWWLESKPAYNMSSVLMSDVFVVFFLWKKKQMTCYPPFKKIKK